MIRITRTSLPRQLATVLLAVSALASALPAQADRWHGHDNRGGRGRPVVVNNYRGGGYRGGGGHGGGGLVAGALLGVVAGAVIANSVQSPPPPTVVYTQAPPPPPPTVVYYNNGY